MLVSRWGTFSMAASQVNWHRGEPLHGQQRVEPAPGSIHGVSIFKYIKHTTAHQLARARTGIKRRSTEGRE